MKNKFLGLAATSLLALLATSCAEEIVETKVDDATYLNYGLATGKQTSATRVAEMTTDGLKIAAVVTSGTPIKVSTYETAANPVAFNAAYELSWDAARASAGTGPFGTGWLFNNGTPVLHPPVSLTHYSVYPDQAFTAGTDGAVTYVDFNYVVTTGGAVDLIAGASTAPTTNASAAAAKANLTFKHILSQINFAVRGLDDYNITITAPALHNIKTSGTYRIGGTGTNSNKWRSITTTTASYTYPQGTTAAITGYNATPIYLTSDTAAPGAVGSTNTNGLMLMPQTLTAPSTPLDTTTDPYFTFTYSINDGVVGGYNKTNIAVNVPLGHTSLGPGGGAPVTWEPGKRYLYIINFESPVFLSYDVVVDDTSWSNASNPEVDVDSNGNGNEADENQDENGHNTQTDF